MNLCPACGETISDTARFCPVCGAALASRSPSARTDGGRRGRCKYCRSEIAVGVNPCPHCGHELRWVRKPASAEASRAESKTDPAKTVDLAQDLQLLGGWGFNNGFVTTFGSVFPGLGCLAGLLLTIFNPFWIIVSLIFYAIGTAKLKRGNTTGAERALAFGRLTNWLLLLPCLVAWSLFFQSCKPGGRVYRMIHEPKVEIVQSAGSSSATKPALPSIRAEMRSALTGGHVLQVWNNTAEPVRCTATLNSPELYSSPTYSFTLEPGAKKPQELGLMQFGHRIKKKPQCSVTIEVNGTGEVYRYTP